jgi:hypothetical protein
MSLTVVEHLLDTAGEPNLHSNIPCALVRMKLFREIGLLADTTNKNFIIFIGVKY